MVALKVCCALLALSLASACSQRAAPVVERTPAAISSARLPSAAAATAPSTAPTAQAAAPASAAAPGYYVVKQGDTLYSIALEHGADYRDVARWNALDDATKIRVGQQLRVRAPEGEPTVQVGAARGAGRPEARPLEPTQLAQQGHGDGSAKTAPKALRLPYSKENAALLSRDETKTAPQQASIAKPEPAKPEPAKPEPPKPEVARPHVPGAIEFIWPAKGPLLSAFGARSKGVDIGGKVGDPIFAAASGKVTYVGSGIPGMGKFLIIMHEKEFLTVYAHTSQILVKEQQVVSRGQKIAEVGASDADKPKLHFQIRRSGSAMDPLTLLPDPS